MYRIRKRIDHSEERKDILTTLALAAYFHETDEGVRDCALKLCERASDHLRSDLLIPLSNTRTALEVILNEIIDPIEEKTIGTVHYNDYHYSIVVKWSGVLDFTIDDIVEMVSAKFLQRGIYKGRIYLSFIHPFYRSMYTTSVLMEEYAKRCSSAESYDA